MTYFDRLLQKVNILCYVMLKKIVIIIMYIVSFLIEKVNSIIMLIVPFIIENVNCVIKQIVSFMIENGNSETENRILVPPGFCDITIKNAILRPSAIF